MRLKSKFTNSQVLIVSAILILFLSACSTANIKKDFLYFQGTEDNVGVQQKETVIQPHDLLFIQVYSKTLNQEQAAIFNILSSSTSASNGSASSGGTSQGYEVSAGGNIEMPVIGTVKAAGLTKDQLQALLVEKVSDYVKNPSIIVRFSNYNINMLGELRAPGAKKFVTDKVTIIDAITAAGDLTEYGRRDDVMVIREINGRKVYYQIDLRSKTVFSSPAYTLQPNDIVYVAPNNKRLQTLNADIETQRKIGLYTTFLGIGITILTLFVYLRR